MNEQKNFYPRLFVALPVPDHIYGELNKLKKMLPELAFSRNFHITLRFIGSQLEAESCAKCLERVNFPQFELSFQRLALFRNKILLAALDASTALLKLKSNLDNALNEIGLAADIKIYRPHITLSRLKRPLSRGELNYIMNASLSGKWNAECFNLYRSLCEPSGAIHTVIKSYKLD